MNQGMQLSQKQFNELVKHLNHLEEMLAKLLEKEETVEGSDEWWRLSDKQALDDVKKGRYTIVSDKKELISHLDSLKKS